MALLAMPLAASAWTPDGDVTVIVAYKAGSGTDTGARLLASQAEKYVGKTLIINNLPGGDGKIGWTELVNSKPDGRTIGFINLPTFTTLAVQPGSTFAVSDVVPVCNQLSETGVVVVRANSPWKSLKELVDACKAKGNLRCSTNGVEASNHTAAQLLATSAGFDYKAIPYGGTADQLLALRRPEHPWNYLPDEPFLSAAGLVGPGHTGCQHPTLAGLLLLGKRRPLREVFPHFRLEYQEADTGFVISTLHPGSPENLFDFYLLVSRRLGAVSALLAQEAGEQAALAGAMREAVLNAILHADYFSRGGLHILRTDTALTVSNGGLLRVSPEKAKAGVAADPRNRGLTQLFSLVRLGTGTGQGLRGIYTLWARRGWRPPVLSEGFQAGVTNFSLPLPRREFTPEELTRQQVIEYLTDHITAAPETLQKALGLSVQAVQTSLDALLTQGLVVPKGAGYTLRA